MRPTRMHTPDGHLGPRGFHVEDCCRKRTTSSKSFSSPPGYRSLLAVQLVRDDLLLERSHSPRTRGPFAVKQIGLVRTFADQAVIAIGNVRLFQDIQERVGNSRGPTDTRTNSCVYVA